MVPPASNRITAADEMAIYLNTGFRSKSISPSSSIQINKMASEFHDYLACLMQCDENSFLVVHPSFSCGKMALFLKNRSALLIFATEPKTCLIVAHALINSRVGLFGKLDDYVIRIICIFSVKN